MATFLRLLVLACVLFAGHGGAAAEIGVGDTREAVIRQTGNPASRAKRGDREIFLYPHGGRVEFLEGKVVDVKGPLPIAPTAPEAPATEPVQEPGATSAATSTLAASRVTSPAKPASLPPAKPPVAPPPSTKSPPNPTEALGQHIEKMDTAWGERPAMPAPEPAFNWPKFFVTLALHFGLTLLALRIAFKVEEMDAFWSGTLAIAGIDLVVYGVLEALGPVTGGISTMGGVQSGVGALVMVATVQKFCFNKRLQNAVVTAMCVKLVVQLCHIFVFVLLLNALFG